MSDIEKKKHYFVIYTKGSGHALKNLIETYIPAKRCEVFIPCMEYYKRSEKSVKVMSIFPGYVFVYTDFNMVELHELLKLHKKESDTGYQELGLKENTYEGGDEISNLSEGDLYNLSDLKKDEEEFFDFLREGNGLLTMSTGYEENKRYVVMDGPLKAYGDRIKGVDKHNRKAFLDIEVNGRCARAGFECKPKTYWYPKENTQIMKLSDGSEVDLDELKRNIMKI